MNGMRRSQSARFELTVHKVFSIRMPVPFCIRNSDVQHLRQKLDPSLRSQVERFNQGKDITGQKLRIQVHPYPQLTLDKRRGPTLQLCRRRDLERSWRRDEFRESIRGNMFGIKGISVDVASLGYRGFEGCASCGHFFVFVLEGSKECRGAAMPNCGYSRASFRRRGSQRRYVMLLVVERGPDGMNEVFTNRCRA